ncbi:MAG TPA: S8 family serine peptidase [Verrucomicrobiae bacterium]
MKVAPGLATNPHPAFASREKPTSGPLPRPHRLANTQQPLSELLGNPAAILLENALLDTARPLDLAIPEPLRSQGDPGAYIVQGAKPSAEGLRRELTAVGAGIVSYIPNNAYLVRASAEAARHLATRPGIQAVLRFEPYYRLKGAALEVALESADQSAGWPVETSSSAAVPREIPAEVDVRLVLFDDAREQSLAGLAELEAQILGTGTSPFGPVVRARCPVRNLSRMAGLSGVQEIELARAPAFATDLSRNGVGVAADTLTLSNYLGLTGAGVLVGVTDSGVDANHPDLAGRVFAEESVAGLDVAGHGTHVAGIIAGNGSQSLTVTNAPGSLLPAGPGQFRGLAPAAKIYAQAFNPAAPAGFSEARLLESAARTNAAISNNSWVYADDNDYDIAAAIYDAAVRDALPGLSASEPLMCVVGAGNSGVGLADGGGGVAGSVQSPATAKNVITVGALEHPRFITNQTWTCTNTTQCHTNTPWLGSTDSRSQVAGFSSRGNVGAGVEGQFGRFKPDVIAPGVFVLGARSSQWNPAASNSPANPPLFGAPDANYFPVLSNLNASVGPWYRFESGTSLSAAEVSGTLALMQEFFQSRVGVTNSPALMKALLINGARPVGLYDFSVRAMTNFQGWGLINLPSSIPLGLTNQNGASAPAYFFDQSPARALATGESRTEFVATKSAARGVPLRVTLAWTDPPANPLAGVKLVNNLDLIVTNLDTGAVFFGNDLIPGNRFNLPWNGSSLPIFDSVNNVETVFLAPPLSAHYSVTVIGKRVNVNAVTACDGVVQDYALVISIGDGQISNALSLGEPVVFSGIPSPQVVFLTNQFVAGGSDFGCIFPFQRVGAGSPDQVTDSIPLVGPAPGQITLGTANQWRFYALTNTPAFTNAAFLTFLSPPLSVDGASLLSSSNPVERREADIDLYVSLDAGLTNLDPGALAAADKSLGRGGCETIVYSNAVPGVYYIGVKCESAVGAQYTLMAVLSDTPFSEIDGTGNTGLRGLPAPVNIPGPGSTPVVCLAPDAMFVRRVLVTNVMDHPRLADITAVLTHGDRSATLLRHPPIDPAGTLVFDDSGEADIPGARHSDGPGTLQDFAGSQTAGQWRLMVTSTNHPGTNNSLWLSLEPQAETSGNLLSAALPSACRRDLINVPANATNLSATFTLAFGTGPVAVQLYPLGASPEIAPVVTLGSAAVSASLAIDETSVPPLAAGAYAVRVCNSGPDSAAVGVAYGFTLETEPHAPVRFTSDDRAPIVDDAVSTWAILVTNTDQVITALDVGVRIDHPRVSDLVVRLVSPAGTRVLLQENRGGLSVAGMGADVIWTNTVGTNYSGGPEAVTNTLETFQHSGTVSIDYDFITLPDQMTVYYENTRLLDTGMVSGSNYTTLTYGPGASTYVTIVMNENGNPSADTAWYFNATSTRIAPLYLTFTENTNFASVPIKFAVPPLTNANYFAPGSIPATGIFYFPEESLDTLAGEPAAGLWTLEVEDTRRGGTNSPCMLLSWQLEMGLRDSRPVPVMLSPGAAFTNTLGPGQIQCFAVDAPPWVAFATNQLLFASVPVNLLFNSSVPPTGTNLSDWTLLALSQAGEVLLRTNGSPALVPGSRYFLAVQNTNTAGVTFAVQIDFNLGSVATLQAGAAYSTNIAGFATDYYRFVVQKHSARAQLEINGPSADVNLFARKGLPLPAPDRFDYFSANPGTSDELIVVRDFSSPVPLSAGEWFLGVVNATGQAASYSVLATESSISGANLTMTESGINNQSFCFTWTSLPGAHYFVQGKSNLTDANWVTVSAGITAADYSTTFCIPLPSPLGFFRVCEGLAPPSP